LQNVLEQNAILSDYSVFCQESLSSAKMSDHVGVCVIIGVNNLYTCLYLFIIVNLAAD